MRGIALALLLLMAGPVWAVLPGEILSDAGLEARARDLSKGLRCLVCRNESIDESNADLAGELRVLVRERLTAGDTDAQVIAYLVDRYGEYVLLEPTLIGSNLILWGAPLALLMLGGGMAVLLVARQRTGGSTRLDAAEEARVRELMDGRG